jgi:hypothetical protein
VLTYDWTKNGGQVTRAQDRDLFGECGRDEVPSEVRYFEYNAGSGPPPSCHPLYFPYALLLQVFIGITEVRLESIFAHAQGGRL